MCLRYIRATAPKSVIAERLRRSWWPWLLTEATSWQDPAQVELGFDLIAILDHGRVAAATEQSVLAVA